MTGTLLEYLCTFVIISHSVLLRMRSYVHMYIVCLVNCKKREDIVQEHDIDFVVNYRRIIK